MFDVDICGRRLFQWCGSILMMLGVYVRFLRQGRRLFRHESNLMLEQKSLEVRAIVPKLMKGTAFLVMVV